MSLLNKLFSAIVVLLPLLAISQQRWEVTIGIPNDDNVLLNKTIDYDNGYLLNWVANNYKYSYTMKTDINGNELWRKTVVNNSELVFLNILLSNNQQTIIGGSTENFPFLLSLSKCYGINWCSKFINHQLFDHGHFEDAVLMNNGDVLSVAYFEPPDVFANRTDRIYLFYYDTTGNLLWYNLYASGANYPLMDTPVPMYLMKFENYFIISGFCWYPYPDNPDIMWLRPLFIRIDNQFNEQWVLPYGVEDSVVGMATGVIEDKQTSDNIGTGRYAGLPGIFSVTPLMHFDSLGNNTGMFLILNDSIGPTIQSNSTLDIVSLGDTNYLLNTSFGDQPYGNSFGELLLDSTYRVINSLSHPNTDVYTTRIDTLPNNQFLFASNIYENPPANYNRDILLYKLNADLSQADYDTATYVYDSLCPDPITSDTIYLNDCGIITGMEEIPTPEAYYKAIAEVQVTAYPNPASGNISFKLKNTKYHTGLQLSIYDISGKHLLYRKLENGQSKIAVNISALTAGMYVAVVSNDRKVLGKTVFSVE